MSKFHNLLVKEVKRETPSAVSVVFEVPKNLRSDFKFIPGQYITIQKELGRECFTQGIFHLFFKQ